METIAQTDFRTERTVMPEVLELHLPHSFAVCFSEITEEHIAAHITTNRKKKRKGENFLSNIIISKTDSMIRQVKKILRELENFRLKLEHPYSEEHFDHLLQAADAAEVTCLQLRQMLVACLSTTKEKLLDDFKHNHCNPEESCQASDGLFAGLFEKADKQYRNCQHNSDTKKMI